MSSVLRATPNAVQPASLFPGAPFSNLNYFNTEKIKIGLTIIARSALYVEFSPAQIAISSYVSVKPFIIYTPGHADRETTRLCTHLQAEDLAAAVQTTNANPLTVVNKLSAQSGSNNERIQKSSYTDIQ